MATATDVAVCIPWRPKADRVAAFFRVEEWYQKHGYRVVFADSADEVFNLSASRNLAVSRAGTQVVVVADADTIPDEAALRRAIRRAHSQDRVFYPFTEYKYLPADAVEVDDLSTVTPIRNYVASVGGVVVMNTKTFIEVGGFDENFRRWGYEDDAFKLAAECLAEVERIPGTIYAFDHTADRDMTTDNPGKARVRLYHFARSDRAVMKELTRTNGLSSRF